LAKNLGLPGITLSECLVGAIRLGLVDLEQAFVDVLQQEQVVFVEITADFR
jgi:hypothetical protein